MLRKRKKKIVVNNNIQKDYEYYLIEPSGRNFHDSFQPDLSPRQMLSLGVFGGYYFFGCKEEFPKSWFKGVRVISFKNPNLNYFKISASQSLKVWQDKGWIHPDDPKGWFQWYARYYMGRRHADDERQIKRWRAFRRHLKAVEKNCKKGDHSCRPKQRQALLHWAYDSRKI
ncbi:hypothetical protein K9M50_02225 [Patescibacteria group bacterium]|nr:hypothetical protein [Patescibacteria group bacterium]